MAEVNGILGNSNLFTLSPHFVGVYLQQVPVKYWSDIANAAPAKSSKFRWNEQDNISVLLYPLAQQFYVGTQSWVSPVLLYSEFYSSNNRLIGKKIQGYSPWGKCDILYSREPLSLITQNGGGGFEMRVRNLFWIWSVNC